MDADLTAEARDAYDRLIRGLYAFPNGSETLPTGIEARDAFVSWVNANGQLTDSLPSGLLEAALSNLRPYPLAFR